MDSVFEQLVTHLGTQSPVSDTVQRDDGDTLPKTPLINEILANLRVLDNDIIQPSTCGNLEGGRLVVVRRFQRDQGSDKSLDF
jgi:hypothetical protein